MDPENDDMSQPPVPGNPDQGAPPSDDDGDESGEMNQLCVPLASLAMPGEDDTMEKPEPGDKGQVNVEYTVDHLEGDNAYINIEAVNGTKLEAPGGADNSPAQQEAELYRMAKDMPAPF